MSARRPKVKSGLVLPLIVAAFAGSVLVRLADGSGAAIASEAKRLMPEHQGDADQGCAPDPDLKAILDRLNDREAKVAANEEAQKAKAQSLAAAEAHVTERLAQLKAAEEKLADTMQQTSTASERDLTKLTSVYEAMKPRDAVPLFEAMDPNFAAGFMARMRPEASAAILTGMKPELAYAISAILAGRNADVPVPKAAPEN